MYKRLATALLMVAAFATAPAMADPPPWAGGKGNSDRGDKGKGKGKGQDRDRHSNDERHSERDRHRDGARGGYFGDNHRDHVRSYYSETYRGARNCPPGLAKKNNGCMPPGQAKKWRVGRPLPRDVVYYSVPPELVVKLGEPQAGHRYVRVAGDILMIAIGSGMVVDAIQNLGRN